MADTLTESNGKHASDGTVTGTGTATSNGPVAGAFTRKDHEPDAFVAGFKLRHRNAERFRSWFRGQFPDLPADRMPAKDDWVDRIFEIGMSQVEREFPPVEGINAQFAKKFGGAK